MRQALGPGALGKPRGSGWRGRWEGGLGWGTHVNPCLFHFNVWQNSLQIKKKKKQSHNFSNKGLSSQSYGFSSSHVCMWEFDHKEGWIQENGCFQTVVLEKTFESSLDSKEIKPVNPKGNQPWIFIGRTDTDAEVPILWPLDLKSWLIGKDPDARKIWGQEDEGATEVEMVGWYHWLNGLQFEETQRDSDGQRSLACYSSWGLKTP